MVIRRFGSVLVLCLRVSDWDGIDGIDLPELESIQMGVSSFSFVLSDVESSTLIMRSVSRKVK